MATENKVERCKLSLLKLAADLSDVNKVYRVMGYPAMVLV